jgi:hypothetical protein
MGPTAATAAAPSEDSSSSGGAGSFGPSLPPGFQRKKKEVPEAAAPRTETPPAKPRRTVKGPARPPQELLDFVADSLTKDDGIGPRVASKAEIDAAEARDYQERIRMLEARSDAAKAHLTGNEVQERESWMTELPELMRKDFGTGARVFRAKAFTVDKDTGWTDTPAERAARETERAQRKAGLGPARPSDEPEGPSDRDRMLAAQVQKHNATKRGESLMDMHKKKETKRKVEEEAKGGSGFTWDRERDMAISMTDPKKRKTGVTSAAGFASRFAPAAGKHFI